MKAGDRSPGGSVFWACLVMGWAVAGFGVWMLYRDRDLTDPLYTVVFALGSNIVHDALVAPVAAVIGYFLVRLLPVYLRGPIAWGLFTTVVVFAMGFVPLSGWGGRDPANPSLLPLDYWVSVPVVFAVVWAVVAAMVLVPKLRRRKAL